MNSFEIFNDRKGRAHFLPFALPRGRNGNCRIQITTQKKGSKVPIVTMRSALYMDMKPLNLLLDRDVRVHWLEEWKGKRLVARWMSSMPQEIESHQRQLKDFHGSVLVGGLGLGIAVHILEQNPNVKKICVCELNRDVIELVEPHIPIRKTIILNLDLYKYLERCQSQHPKEHVYDCAFYDIWCPTGQRVLTQHVLPLRRLSVGVIPQSGIECWDEDVMLGQTRNSLHNLFSAQKEPRIPFDGSPRDRFKTTLAECWAYFNWLWETMPDEATADKKAVEYIAALKSPPLFDKIWGKWNK